MQTEIEELTRRTEPKEVVDYSEKLTVLQYALEQYTNCTEGENVPESVIEAFVVKIVVSKDGFDWYLRFDGDPDKPLHCKLDGKRKTNTKIMVAGDISPAMDSSSTGCYQESQKLSFQRFATFTVKREDAKEYMYSISKRRRVHRWRDFQMNFYI